MDALIFNLKLNSLFSIRVPFTWQSALTYPILPPSSIIGLLANALQRYKNDKHPLEYLKLLDDEILWAGSRLLTPCLIKSYTTSAITKFEVKIGGKSTNALIREYGFIREFQIIVIFNEKVPEFLIPALISTPLTCGDSESSCFVNNKPEVVEVEEIKIKKETIIKTTFPVKYRDDLCEGSTILLMHERCLKKEKKFPLFLYLCPLTKKDEIISPTSIEVKAKEKDILLKVKEHNILIRV